LTNLALAFYEKKIEKDDQIYISQESCFNARGEKQRGRLYIFHNVIQIIYFRTLAELHF